MFCFVRASQVDEEEYKRAMDQAMGNSMGGMGGPAHKPVYRKSETLKLVQRGESGEQSMATRGLARYLEEVST